MVVKGHPGRAHKGGAGAVELLAPAGEKAAAYAAFAFGADAVYTGLPKFSARAEAVNLSAADLEEVCAFAHGAARRRKVYVTLNTLVRMEERAEVIRALALCAECGADAVIVQDAGVARLAKRYFPELRLHASTQMAIHNAEGAREAVRLGFKRVTLARELTMEEIRSLVQAVPVEVESFVQGALCYSYSGLCLYSALLRGRSGNRGACAYPCRDWFAATRGGEGHGGAGRLPFAMKDLSAVPCLQELVRTGVHSLKIEGRKKSPLYVAAAVRLYRGLLDGTFSAAQREEAVLDLQTVFSRPWTTLHLRGRGNADVISPEATGHRGAPLGRVDLATHSFLQFRTKLPLEVHDGIQLMLAGETRPCGFAVEELTLEDGRQVFAAPAGALVEVPLPRGTPFVPKGTELFLASSQATKRRLRFELPNPREWRRRIDVEVRVRAENAEGALADAEGAARLVLEAVAGRGEAIGPVTVRSVMEGPMEAAKHPEGMASALKKTFEQLGDTPFVLRDLQVEGVIPFVPLSRLKECRREWAAALETAWTEAGERRVERAISVETETDVEAAAKSEEAPPKAFLLKTDAPEVLLAAYPTGELPEAIAEVTLELDGGNTSAIEAVQQILPERVALRLALPMIVRAWEREGLTAQIRHFMDRGQRRWEAANVGSMDFLVRGGVSVVELDVSADWPLYALNTSAVAAGQARGMSRFTVAPEDTPENAAALAQARPGIWVWPVRRDPPLFISENCPHAAQTGGCPGNGACGYEGEELRNRAGETVRVVNRRCRFYTLSEAPQVVPLPPGVSMIPRADFLLRPITPEAFRREVKAVVARTMPKA